MFLTISYKDQFLSLEVSKDITLKELKLLISSDLNTEQFDLLLNNNLLTSDNDNKQLQHIGFTDNEMLLAIDKQLHQQIQQQQPVQQVEPVLNPIDESLQHALENTPEIFGSISMLYINLSLNNTPIKAFVDSGAQQTIISSKLAAQCQLTHLIDTRFKGMAMGVGSTQIQGRIHSAMIKIEHQFLPVSLTVLDTHVDFLLGLDMLRRYQGIIDLKQNVLKLADDVITPFLGESEIPKNDLLTSTSTSGSLGQNIFSEPPATTITASNVNPSTTTVNANPSITPTPAVPAGNENDINQLIALGASRSQAIQLLKETNGNLELAASLLF